MPELYQLIYGEVYDIILITESWLHDKIPNSLIDPRSLYTVIRHDRMGHNIGGGVCALISNVLNVTEVILSEVYAKLEICCFDVQCSAAKIRFLNVYNPPNVSCMSNIVECLCKYTDATGLTIITGDFNCPGINWTNLTAPNDATQGELLNFSLLNGFSQLVREPTRMKNTLDLIFVNEPISVCDIDVKQPFSSSDHSQISFSVFVDNRDTADCTELTSCQQMYDWGKGDYESMSQFLMSVNWYDILAYNLTVDSLWSAFYDILSTAVSLYVPKKTNQTVK